MLATRGLSDKRRAMPLHRIDGIGARWGGRWQTQYRNSRVGCSFPVGPRPRSRASGPMTLIMTPIAVTMTLEMTLEPVPMTSIMTSKPMSVTLIMTLITSHLPPEVFGMTSRSPAGYWPCVRVVRLECHGRKFCRTKDMRLRHAEKRFENLVPIHVLWFKRSTFAPT